MNKPLALPPLALGRAVAREIIDMVDQVQAALLDLPARVATPVLNLCEAVKEHVLEVCPGGFLDFCEGCGQPIGLDDTCVVSDAENVIYLCPLCAPSPEDIAAQQAEKWADRVSDGDPMVPMTQLLTRDGQRVGNATVLSVTSHPCVATIQTDAGNTIRLVRSEIDELFYPPRWVLKRLPAMDAATKGGWVDWNGGDCPLHADARVEVRLRKGHTETGRSAEFIWLHGDEINSLPSEEIVAYRIVKRDPKDWTPAPVSERRVPRFDPPSESPPVEPAPEIDWSNAFQAAMAVGNGIVPPGYRIEDGVLIVSSDATSSRLRGASAIYASFDEIRDDRGKVLKSIFQEPDGTHWAPPAGEELQLLHQIWKADGSIRTNHSATQAITKRLNASGDVFTHYVAGIDPTASRLTICVELTDRGKRRLAASGRLGAEGGAL